MSSILKIIITILVLAGIGFFGYNYLTRSSSPNDTLIEQTGVNTSAMGVEVLSALNQLRTLKLDGSIFKDKTFMSLHDFSKPILPEPVGRINPFSPIGVEVIKNVKTAPIEQNTSTTTASSTKKTTGN